MEDAGGGKVTALSPSVIPAFKLSESMKFKQLLLSTFGILASVMIWSCSEEDIKPVIVNTVTVNAAVDNINANIVALKKSVEAQSQGLTVGKVVRLVEDDGALIGFSDGTTIALRTKVGNINGEGPASYTPLIGVQSVSALGPDDRENIYCWSLDGEPLNSGGHPVLVESATPVLSVSEAGEWVLEVNGESRQLGKVSAGEQKSVVSGIDVSDRDNIRISFANSEEVLSLAAGGGTQKPDDPVKGDLRRPISPSSPAWLVHIDSWNYPDPNKIIDLIPEDIRPYVIFNLSLSVSHDESTGRFRVSEYGYEIVKSWLRTCAERNVWAMIQPASGGWCHFPDVSSYDQFDQEGYGMYKEFFEEYPNFLGFNYCEQFWGFDGHDAISSPTWDQRVEHWRHLLQLTHEYGGYLTYSFCANYWSAPINPVAMMKKHPEFAEVASRYSENFIVCEKYTQSGCFFDVEAECMGAWVSGHADNYGIRFDQCAWNEWASQYYFGKKDADFPVALGAALQLEHITLTGQTVIDGPELIWQQDFHEDGLENAGDGYQVRRWTTFPQFRNINIDLFRKILDGTIRIMSKQEVIDRSKVVVIQDVQSGAEIERYCLPKWFHLGTSALDHDGGREDNHFYLRKTGRYPAIPVVAELKGAEANSFKYKYNQSSLLSTWDNTSTKTRELNRLFPQEYTGDIFAARHENTWVTYNPLKDKASGKVPFQYNTCQSMELELETFTTGVWKEYANRLTCYLTNYNVSGRSVTTTVKINGASRQPSFDLKPRVSTYVNVADEKWEDDVYTLVLEHNGPLDLTISCSGAETDRLTDYTTAQLSVPQSPNLYYGPRQYEAEVFEFKSVGQRVGSGYDQPIRNYTGQGYINFGKNKNAAVRDEVSVIDEGRYSLQFRYRAPSAAVNTVDLYVNGEKIDTMDFIQSGSDNGVWYVATLPAFLKEGKNIVELKANAAGASDLYLDNLIVEAIP